GSPSRPTTTTASTPLERLSASTTSRMVAIRAANVGFPEVEVKQRLRVDPLGGRPVSSPALPCVSSCYCCLRPPSGHPAGAPSACPPHLSRTASIPCTCTP